MALNWGLRSVLATLLLVLGLAFPAEAREKTVDVRILERWVGRIVEVRAPAGAAELRGRPLGERLKLEARGHQLWLNGQLVLGANLEIGTPNEGSRFEVRSPDRNRKYRGRLRVLVDNGQLVLINTLPLETYVAGVVTAEMPENWPVEALRAQAVLARTLALKGGDHPGGRLCDLTHCQVYGGEPVPEGVQVALETRRQVLVYRGSLIEPLFHSTCGGERVSNAMIFEGPALPYLREGTDPYCADSPHAQPWSVRVLESELASSFGFSRVEDVSVLAETPGGWVARITVNGRQMSGYRFWQAVGRKLGWGVLKSMRFSVRKDGRAFVFDGSGLGHGVGLCQWGARGQALKGIPYARILASYFPGTAIARR